MKVWYDAGTGKQLRYGAAISEKLRKAGHEVLLTTREHPDTIALAQVLREKVTVVGHYSPESLASRVEESARRTIQLTELIKDHLPDVAISHQSPELCRTAFGLHVPIVLTADTPHAEAVNRLTVPLAEALVTSEAIPKTFFNRFGAKHTVQFKGVDEVAWIKNLKPTAKTESDRPLIVVRQMETRAAYCDGKKDETEKLAQQLSLLGEVLFISRYNRTETNGINNQTSFIDSAILVSHADLVVSAGGTISREAALQGVPSIAISDMAATYVNKYLANQGFPLFITNTRRAIEISKKYLGKRFNVKAKLARMKDPVDTIKKVATQLAKKDA